MPQIKYIVFDCGNVLEKFDYMIACEKLAKYTALADKEIYDIFASDDITEKYSELERGKLDPDDFVKLFLEKIGASKKITFDVFKMIWDEIYAENTEIEGIIKKIKPDIGIKVLSNTNILHWGYMSNLPLMKEYFSNKEDRILSFEVGSRKPERKIYEETVKQCSCQAENILFIDDMPENIEGFKNLGTNTILYNCQKDPITYLESEMRKFDVLQN